VYVRGFRGAIPPAYSKSETWDGVIQMAEATQTVVATMGEVRTGLLRNSVAISSATATGLLRFVAGEKVRTFERPIPQAISPERLTGVDCHLTGSSGARIRAVGTVTSRAAITGGHLALGSAYVRVVQGTAGRRLPWSHYLANPGTVETVGKTTAASIVDGFVSAHSATDILDLAAIADRALETVQSDGQLDQNPPFRTRRTRLRWLTTSSGYPDDAITFRLEPDLVRTVRLPDRDLDPAALATLCEDLALHDWLLTTLLSLIDRTPIGSGNRKAVIDRLRPALDYLLHLWMPAARTDPALIDLWDAMERRPGLNRQWQATVSRIRDQLALAAVI
jgi:hypothetical protein